jgi:signal transduction histidine kinase
MRQKVFERENDFLNQAQAKATAGNATPEDYGILLNEYERLLRQGEKIVVIGDVTQNKLIRAQKMLHRAIQRYKTAVDQKSEILSLISHDIKNKIAPIRELSHWIIEDLTTDNNPAHALELIRHISDASEQLTKSVNDTLHRESTHSTAIVPVFELADLSKLAASTVDNQRLGAGKKNIELVAAIDPKCEAVVDEFLIGEIFENLVSNAVKFSPPSRKVGITLSTTDIAIVFSVRDQGPGLTDEDKAQLFGKYHTLSAKPTGGEVSTGVGLYISSKLAALHKGTLEAASDGPGKGTTFTFTLPLPEGNTDIDFKPVKEPAM